MTLIKKKKEETYKYHDDEWYELFRDKSRNKTSIIRIFSIVFLCP